MKKIISIVLTTAMLLCMFPIVALAGYASYENFAYTEVFEFGDIATTIESSDVYTEILEYSMSGYAKTYALNLTENRQYEVNLYLSTTDATSGSLSFWVFKSLTGDIDADLYTYDYRNMYGSSIGFNNIFDCDSTGTYYLLVLAEAENSDGELFGEDTSLSISIWEYERYTSTDFSENMAVGEDKEFNFSLSDPEIFFNDDGYAYYGYANGATIELEGDTYYTFSIDMDDNAYFDGRIIVLNENLSGIFYEDLIATMGVDFGGEYYFYANETGKYKLLFFGYIFDNEHNLVIDNSGYNVTARVEKTTFETIEIKTADELIKFGENAYNDNFETDAVKAVIMNDIDMSELEWVSIYPHVDLIVIDGKGHTINGLHDSLFSYIEDVIVGIYDITVDIDYDFDNTSEGCDDFSAFAKVCYGTYILKYCHATGDVKVNAYYIEDMGSYVGELYRFYYVDGCTSTVKFDLTATDYISYVGGIFGYNSTYYTNSIFEDSFWNGSINAYCSSDEMMESIKYLGGFGGDDEGYSYYKNCYAAGEISVTVGDGGTCYDIGGFVGYIEDFSVFENCFADVDITADKRGAIGGFAGFIDEANIFKNCYTSGSVIGQQTVGGFVADSSCCGNNLFLNCYSTSDVSGEEIIGGFIGKFYYGDLFVNCYTSGTVESTLVDDPATPENELEYFSAGSFFGVGEFDSEEKIFDNCFAFASDMPFGHTLNSSLGKYEDYTTEDITEVDFSLDVVVEAMVFALNEKVDSLIENGFEGLLHWGERNEDNGPMLIDEPGYILGDVNADGFVDADDYILLKRVYFGSAKLEILSNPETAFIRSDVDKDGSITGDDYIILKRVYFGMAKL